MAGENISKAGCLLVISLIWCFTTCLVFGDFDKVYSGVEEIAGDPPKVRFECRLQPSEKIEVAVVKADGKEVVAQFMPYTLDKDKKSAVLFVVDVSNPKRSAEVKAAAKMIEGILDQGNDERHVFGILPFEGRVDDVFAPLGTPVEDLKVKTKELKAKGLNTVLYGSVLKGLEFLEKVDADRKSIVVVSDWKAEDNVMDTKEFVTKALEAMKRGKIVCHSLVLVEEDQSELDTAEKLATETGGVLENVTRGDLNIPDSFVEGFMSRMENGGSAVVELAGDRIKSKQVLLEVKTKQGNTYTLLHERTPDPDEEEMEEEPVEEELAEEELAEEAEEESIWSRKVVGIPLWIILAGCGVLALIVITVIVKKLFGGEADDFDDEFDPEMEEPGDDSQLEVNSDGPASPYPAQFDLGNGTAVCGSLPEAGDPIFATLQFGESGRRGSYPISRIATRIGRSKDNDLTFNNDSVSRHHAEILRKPDGSFIITDLDSGNGLEVNGNPEKQVPIRTGDTVSLGEVSFSFVAQG